MRRLFDQYAARYDAALTEHLAYRGPAILRDAVETAMRETGRPMRFGSVLDLGCGTGLGGAAFRPVRRLAGRRRSVAGDDRAGGDQGSLRSSRHRRPHRILSPMRAADRRTISSRHRRRCLRLCERSCADRGRHRANPRARTGCWRSRSRPIPATASKLLPTLRYAHGEDLPACRARRKPASRLRHLAEASVRSEKGVPVDSLVVVAQPSTAMRAPASSAR